MLPAAPLPLFDAALRGALIVLMLLLGARLARDRIDAPAARVGTLLMVCLSVQVFASLPAMENAGPWWWQAPLVGISVGNSVLFWVFSRALFDDDFDWRPFHLATWLAVVGLGVLFFALVVMPQRRELAPFPLAVAIAMRWTPLVFAALAIAAAASQWRADLVERRRRLRVFILAMGSAYTVTTATARLASDDGRMSDWMSSVDIAMLLVIIGTIAARVLRVIDTDLLPRRVVPTAASALTPAVEAPVAAPPAPDPAEDRLAAELQRLMAEERTYRTEDLTVASLAALLKTPEYRLRRLINQRLGHRNFNAYVNGFRLDEAQRWLADPAQREVPILTVALDAGFQSIGPFNRAFKAATGLTPTEFRREKLGEAGRS